MVKYSCEQCGKEFPQKSHYDSHKRRKTQCGNIEDKLKLMIDKAVEEKFAKELNKKLIGENEVKIDNMVMDIPTIDKDFQIVKKYYDDILNKDSNLVETTNDEPTPIDCVEEMVNKIPEVFWKNKNNKILDPCCGCGNFPFVIYFKLLKYHTKEHILNNILYFNDINLKRIEALKAVFNYKLNIFQEDFLTLNTSIKFDLVVANPPYAKLLPNGKRASKNHNLIGIFINKSLEVMNEKGYLLYITPDNWMSYADRNTLILKLTKFQIHYINIHTAKKYFKKIGSSFVWYLIEKTPSYKNIEIEGLWKKKIYTDFVKSEIRNYIPLYYNSIIQSILSKTIDNKEIIKFEVKTSSDLHKYTKKTFISAEENDIYKYKLIHTPKQVVWSSKPHKYQKGYKVFISTTSYYGTFVDNCGMTQSIAFLQCKNEDEANILSNVLKHPMYKFINDICRYGNFNNIRILQSFPYCEDYECVYKKFNINDEEIKFIENNN
jgi:adenine-specific DNA-methyltransferase